MQLKDKAVNKHIFKEVLGSGSNIVLIHGGGASHRDMHPIAQELSLGYCVTNIDLPGTGTSSWEPSIKNIHDIADYVIEELPPQAVYIGWSFGGLVAQSIAARYPNRISRLIGIGTTPCFIETDDWPGFPATGFSAILDALFKKGNTAKDFLKMFYESEFDNINPKSANYCEVQKLCAQPSTISNELLSKRIAICDATDLRGLFKSILCPVDFILGNQDNNIPKEAFVKIKELNLKVKIHEIQGCGHAPFWTHPSEFNQILRNILT